MRKALFDFNGRMNRAPFWGWSLVVIGLMFVFMVAAFVGIGFTVDTAYPEAEREELILAKFNWVVVLAAILTIWPLAALTAKRLQDLARPVWWTIPVMIPSVVSMALYVAFGTKGPERGPFWWLDVALTVVTVALTIWLGFIRGTRGDNPFGPDPVAGKEAGKGGEVGVGV
ncbi:MAG TPA: DUF805 domain-containing protein [Gemmatimonadaceae bacterium]|nr:DUF805 domain-containing protein [Gemmatimonadaceae bacterium]